MGSRFFDLLLNGALRFFIGAYSVTKASQTYKRGQEREREDLFERENLIL
jgi:hypothetical protein